ncbi:MAG TPA: tetratricopeptide repeat protein [Gemmatimonadales bacterium]|nr:tetratricopeptide repeat protein [Gemmatimonadales bacterium]
MLSLAERLAGAVCARYAVERELGSGGMATVFLARDLKHHRRVAIKVLLPELSVVVGSERFLSEIRVTASLQHPNILPLFDSGEADGLLYYVMPVIPGESLRERLEREKQLGVEEAIRITTAVASALDYAHRQNVIHRDIKPANVLLHDKQVFVTDFGIAVAMRGAEETRLTATGMLVGTPQYMSPEQAGGDQLLTPASDIYSLAAVLYELLAGVVPHTGPTSQAIFARMFTEEPTPIRSLRNTVPAHVERALAKALAKAPADRFTSAAAFSEALSSPDARDTLPTPSAACPSCHHENPVGHRFCAECGAALAVTCESCGASVASGAAFCGACGEAFTHPEPDERTAAVAIRSALTEPERRHVTVLHASLSGYATLLEQVDAGEVERRLVKLREGAAGILAQHGGMLNRFSTDELVALFGVPVAHEDDAIRAVRAALELQEFFPTVTGEVPGQALLEASVGVSTGLVVAVPSRRENEQYSLAGDAVGVAARLALQAGTNDVLVSSETDRLLTPFYRTERLNPVSLSRGGPIVTPHRVLEESDARTRLAAAARVALTPFAGRDAEMRSLQSCLDRVLRGEGQVVSVVGDAGVGKTRLSYEFRSLLHRVPVRIIEGRCRVLRETTPYLPFIEALRGVLDPSGLGETEYEVESVIARLRAMDPNLGPFIPLFLHLLSLHSEQYPFPEHLKGEDLRLAIVEGLAAVFSLACAEQPLVMFLEDWHWADDASQDMLRQFAGMVAAFPILIVATGRPDRVPDVGELGHHTMIHLGPLEVTTSLAVVAAVLQVDRVPVDLGRRLHERTAGNPFFLEELCYALQEEGLLRVNAGQATVTGKIESLHLPDTIQAVLQSRLDRITPDAREVLRVASVIGREFSREILERTIPASVSLPPSLETLKSLGMIQQIRVLPKPEYRFKHALTLEVAYESLVQHQRKALHGVVGQAIEELDPGLVDEQPDVLAYHFTLAEQWPAAVRYGRIAAKKARRVCQFADELRILDNVHRSLAKLAPSDERRNVEIEVLLALERAYETAGDQRRQREIIDELMSLIDPTIHKRQLAETLIRQGDLYTLLGRSGEAGEALNRSIDIWQELSDRVGERNALRSIGFLRWQDGDYERAIRAAEATLVIDRELGDVGAVARDLNNYAMVLKAAGQIDRALAVLEEAGQLPTEKKDYALFTASLIYRERGEIDRAMEYLKKVHEINRRTGLRREESFTLAAMAGIALDQGKPDESVRIYEELVGRTREVQYAVGLALGLERLGELLVALERPTEALPSLREGAELLERMGEGPREAVVRRRLAKILENELGDYPAATREWKRIARIAHEMGDRKSEFDALDSLARLSRRESGDGPEAVEYLTEALALAHDLDDAEKQSTLLNTLGVLHWKQGDHAKSLTAYRQALAIFRQRGDQLHEGLVLNSIGVVLRDSQRYEDALEQLRLALAINRATGQRRLEAHSLAILGDVFTALGKPKEALVQYEASLTIRRELEDRSGEGWMLLRIAQVEASQAQWDRALDYAAQARTIADETGDAELRTECERMADSTTN